MRDARSRAFVGSGFATAIGIHEQEQGDIETMIENMNDSKDQTGTSVQRANRVAAVPLLGTLLLAAVVTGLPACEKKDGGVSEAVEEIQDEAKDAKDEIKDEIDDHS